jgi:hypothetical protein
MRCRATTNLEEYLTAYLDDAGLRDDPKGPLFRTMGAAPASLLARCYLRRMLMQ